MYQFSEMFKEITPEITVRNYRGRGFLAGLVLGWLPAWWMAHGRPHGGWWFWGGWLACILAAYSVGRIIKKK